MKTPKTWLSNFLIMYSILACNDGKAQEIVVKDKRLVCQKSLPIYSSNEIIKDSEKVYDLLEKLDTARPSEFLEMNNFVTFLPILHPNLNTKYMCFVSHGKYEGYILPQITDSFLISMAIRLEDAKLPNHPSYPIFTINFWESIQDFQEKGIAVGFKYPEIDYGSATGVFFSKFNLIAVDWRASKDTLTHEYQHFLQHQKLNEIGHRNPRSLGYECANALGTFFGELDASTSALPEWVEYFENIQYRDPNAMNMGLEDRPVSRRKAYRYPMIARFVEQMNYPAREAGVILDKTNCPRKISSVFKKVYTYLNENVEITIQLDSKIKASLLSTQAAAMRHPTLCENEETKQACQTFNENLRIIDKTKQEFTELINNQIDNRKHKINQILFELPWKLHKELCHFNGGYAVFTDCGM